MDPLHWTHHNTSHFKIHQQICLELFSLVNGAWSVHISLLIQTRQIFSLEKAMLWIEDSYFSWKQLFYKTCSFSLNKMFTGGLEWCGLLVDYCDVFISCLDSHSDGTYSLQRIHWCASDVMLNSSKFVQTHLHLGWLFSIFNKY